MNYLQEGMEKMSMSTILFLQNNTAILSLIPGITPFIASVQSTNQSIAVAKVQQEANSSRNTSLKKQLRLSVITQGIDIASRLMAMSINTNNTSLQALIDYTKTDLVKSTDSNLISICQVIRDNANLHLTALAPYGVTPAIVATLQTSINSFSAAIPKARIDTTGSAEITKQLIHHFNDLKTTWKKIDILVEIVRLSHPAFYGEYKKLRRVITRGSIPHSLIVQTLNAQTGAPEANVIITLTLVNDKLKTITKVNKALVIKKTAMGGGAFLRNISDGTYHVSATKTGFQESIMTIAINNGESTSLTINLQAQQHYGTA